MRHIIVGAGPAGLSAVETLRRIQPEAEVILLSAEKRMPYSRPLTVQWIAGKVAEDRLQLRSQDYLERLGVDLRLDCPVKRVERDNKRVVLEDGSDLPYDLLLLATGSCSTWPTVPGIPNPSVFSLSTYQDAVNILRASEAAREAVIVGAGLVGLQLASALRHRGLRVTVVDQFSQILLFQLDSTAASIFHRAFREAGINLLMEERLTSVEKESRNGRVSVSLERGKELACDMVLTATGVCPNTSIVEDNIVAKARGILVDEYLRTSADSVFAAGDVAEAYDVVIGQPAVASTWSKAWEQGRYAAYNMAGKSRRYPGAFGTQFAMEYLGIQAISLGLPPRKVEDVEILVSGPDANGAYKKVVLHRNHIVHAILVGDLSNAGFLAALIRQHADISKFRHKLLDPSMGYAAVLMPPRREMFDFIAKETAEKVVQDIS